jgi:hypothetical protein
MKNRYYQQGGEMEQLMQLFQAFADTVQDDEFSTAEEVMQMFQELSPEEQQAFVQQAMQIVQAPQQEQMELEEPTMQRGGYVNNTGYLEGYETSKNPINIIPSSKISMVGVDPKIKYIKGTDNLGNTQYMEHGGEYEFDGDFVVEEPVYAQTGGDLQDSYQYKIQRADAIKNLLKNPNLSSSKRSILTTELVKNAKDLKQLETKIQNTPKVNESKIKEIQQAKKIQAAKKAIEKTTAERIAKSKGITNLPLSEQQAIAADDAFNLTKKETPLPFYERMRQAKIDKGISTGAIKPVPNVNLSIGNIGEVALQKLSN